MILSTTSCYVTVTYIKDNSSNSRIFILNPFTQNCEQLNTSTQKTKRPFYPCKSQIVIWILTTVGAMGGNSKFCHF